MSSYEETYQDWVSSLSKSKLAKLKKLGLDKPLNDNGRLNTPNNADVVFANLGTDFDYDSLDSSIFDKGAIDMQADDNSKDIQQSNLLSWIILRLKSRNARNNFQMDLDCLVIALGMENLIGVKSQTELAKLHDTTKANISHRVKDWQKLVGSRPSMLMKSVSACNAYREARLKNINNEI